MRYNKLVRDHIPEYIRSNGGEPLSHVAEPAEYWQKLKEKVLEEFEEFSRDESLEEFADLLEVIEAIAAFKEFDSEQIQKAREEKAAQKGRFEKRIVLEEA